MQDWMALDRVVSLGDDRGVALRNVPNTLAVFDTHFPNKPVVPGVLIMGSIARLAALVLGKQTGHDDWTLAGVSRVRYRHFVQPGDQIELTVDVKSVDDGEATCKGSVTVDGTAVTTFGTLAMRRRGAT